MYLFWILLPILVVGSFVAGYFIRKWSSFKTVGSAEKRAETIINEAKNKQKEFFLTAKDKALKIIDDAKQEERQRRQEIKETQTRLEKRESLFDQKLMELENKRQQLHERTNKLERIKVEIQKIKEDQFAKLEKIAELSREDARQVLLDNTEKKIKEELVQRVKKLQHMSSEELDQKSREMLSLAIQRCSSSHAAETTTSVISLPSDDMKGRIIGREGRNIKTIERLTGVEIIVDDTPEAIVISGFSPIRRNVAKRALEKLILDGRIQPARIEEAIEEAKKETARDIKKAGEDATYEVGIAGLDNKLVQVIGRLKYRTSYGQNVLRHSVEVANLSAILAEELGADVAIAKKAGFLHDIGKAVDQEIKGTHPEIGRDIAKKFGLPESIVQAIYEHHEDMPSSLEGIIVKVADSISGARPGARSDTYENYLQRLDELEKVATSFDGVDKAYAIQAGREVRVFVTPDEIDDLAAVKLARDVAGKIEDELRYPGEIKVSVIRETRITDYAR